MRSCNENEKFVLKVKIGLSTIMSISDSLVIGQNIYAFLLKFFERKKKSVRIKIVENFIETLPTTLRKNKLKDSKF